MHKHYGGIPDGVPLLMLCEMVEQAGRWEIEEQVKPIWFIQVIADKLRGITTEITLSDLIDEVMKSEKSEPKPERPIEEISRQFESLIKHDRGLI